MSTPIVPAPSPSPAGQTLAGPPRTPGAFGALYRLVLRHQLNRGRLFLFGAITALCVVLGWVIGRASDDRAQDAVDTVSALGLGLIVPVVALVLGSAALGTWVDDETLVYVWLRPVRRWVVAVAATLAAVSVAVPVTVVALSILAALGSGGDADAIAGTAIGAAFGGVAYTAVFVALGLLIRRALLWGLIYVFIWEFFVARAGDGASRLSINSYAASLLSDLSGIEIRLADRAAVTSYIVLTTITVVATAFTTWRLQRANVA